MRPVLRGLAVALFASSALPAWAQQGSVQITGAAQGLTGDPQRLGGQHRVEPDFGITWLQPGARFGIFQMEVRGTRRQDRFHAGRLFVAIREKKHRGWVWSLEGGDTHFLPAIGDYKFSNLFTPAVTFNGAAVTARTERTSVAVVAGRATAWRNIFGTDPQTLGQGLGSLRVTHRLWDRLDVSLRASRIRTTDVREFRHLIESSDQAGGGARLWLTPSLQVAGDVSAVSFVRVGSGVRERDVSGMAGLNWLHRRGWIQVNASRFSAGDFPTLNTPLPDREAIHAAGDYELLPRLRVFGGWEAFRSNLDPQAAMRADLSRPEASGTRQVGGLRLRLASRSTLAVRAEQGARVSRPLRNGIGSDSDTGSWSTDFQTSAGPVMTSARYAQRRNVDRLHGVGSYNQHDLSLQLFATLNRSTQLFGSAMAMRNELAEAGGSTYWQAGGGAQVQVPRRDLWLRSEVTLARNVDLLTQDYVPRESLNAGVNGHITRNMLVAFNVHVDRSPNAGLTGSPWMTRSTLRVTRMLPTGSAYMTTAAAVSEATTGRGTGSVLGSVFADWNGDGVFDEGDELLEGIAVMIGAGNVTTTSRDGRFTFLNVPTGPREVALDTSALPIDYDPPDISRVEIHLARGDAHRVSFPLTPLGTIRGRVFRDANGTGILDAGDEPIDGAIVVLDGGARSEQVRQGQFRFDAVRGGGRVVRLLLESLPEGAAITGDAEVATALTRERMTVDVNFLVSIEKRPEIRRVFPARGGTAAAAPARGGGATTSTGKPPAAARGATPPASPAAKPSAARPRVAPAVAAPAATGRFVVQIAAFHNHHSAAALVQTLVSAGLPAYISHPGPSDPSPYRIRVGPFTTQAAAQKAARELGQQRGEQLWVTRER